MSPGILCVCVHLSICASVTMTLRVTVGTAPVTDVFLFCMCVSTQALGRWWRVAEGSTALRSWLKTKRSPVPPFQQH